MKRVWWATYHTQYRPYLHLCRATAKSEVAILSDYAIFPRPVSAHDVSVLIHHELTRRPGYACLIEWFEEQETVAAQRQVRLLGDGIRALAEKRNDLLAFKFMNDASISQDVSDGYGAMNVAALRDAARKYDSASVFQTLQNGGFRLG